LNRQAIYIFLAETTNRKEKLIPWLFFDPPRKLYIFLAIFLHRQEKSWFPWQFVYTVK
jgi:hypothetical protein